MENKETIEDAAVNSWCYYEHVEDYLYSTTYRNGFKAGAKWQAERMYSEEGVPTELEPVLAKINHQNDLGLSQWYEVVYYADDKWCSYSGSKTFQNGERVIGWVYCKNQFKKNKDGK
jgi:hypothetical protein